MKNKISVLLFIALALCSCVPEAVHVSGITLNTTTLTIPLGNCEKLTAHISPSNADNQAVIWTSGNASVASVEDGNVTALSPGETSVTATSDDGGLTAVCKIIVPEVIVPVAGIKLDKESLTMVVGQAEKLTATIEPENASYQDVRWTTSDPTVAAIKEDGTVTALALGKATITVVTTDGGFSASCNVDVPDTKVSSVSLDRKELTLQVGGTDVLVATVLPENATNKEIRWESSDASVVTVSAEGEVKAVALGKATVTVITADGGFSASCNVDVPDTKVSSVSLDRKELTLQVGGTDVLVATVLPENATNKEIRWESSDASVVTVSAEGEVKAVALGKATVTVITADGGKSASCTVNVPATAVTSVSLDKPSLTLQKGGKATLVASVLPEDATNKAVRWSSSDDSIVSVNEKGEISALAAGKATVSVITQDGGLSAECKVTVEQHATGISLSASKLDMKVYGQAALTATVAPEDADDKTVEWKSSDESRVSVTGGVLNAKEVTEKGKPVVITATAKDGGFSATCEVTVTCDVYKITLNTDKAKIKKGEKITLTADVDPDNASNPAVTWASSAPSVASVKDGEVTALSVGTASITVTSAENPNVKATCAITVYTDVTGISVKPTSLDLLVGQKQQLTATLVPDDAETKDVRWTTSNAKVATVSDKGLVEAKGPGDVQICATTVDGGLHAFCDVNVRGKVNAVEVFSEPAASTLLVGKTLQYKYQVYPEDRQEDVSVVWSVEYAGNTAIATIDKNGLLTAKAKGTVTVKAVATDVDGTAYTGKATLEIQQPVTKISVSPASLTIYKDDIDKLTVSLSPSDANNLNYNYKVSNEGILESSRSGNEVTVKAVKTTKKEEVVTLTFSPVFPSDDKPTATATVTVRTHVNNILVNNLQSATNYITVGAQLQVDYDVVPTYAYDRDLVWSSSKPQYVTVSETGLIKAVSAGESTITVSTKDKKSDGTPCVTREFKVVAQDIKVSSVTLDKSSLDLTVGDKFNLTATVKPDNAANKTVTWSSSNSSVASVSQDGVVTAVAPGNNVVIKVTTVASASEGGVAKTAECTVNVKAAVVKVTGVTVSPTTINPLEIGKTQQLYATVSPSTATDKTVTWRSKDPSIVSVNDYGLVTAHSQGATDIVVTTKDGGFTAECKVTVPAPPVSVTSVSLSATSKTLTYSQSFKLTATVLPSNATDKSVTWKSSDTSVASVEDGIVTAASKTGTATITATSVSNPNAYATCLVDVKASIVHVSYIDMSKVSMKLYINQSEQLYVIFHPSNADNKKVTWSVSQGGVASVDQNGLVKGMKAGYATVKATSEDGGYDATCMVTVTKNEVNSISISKTKIVLTKGEYYTLTAQAIGKDSSVSPSYPGITWSSGNNGVATVDSSGKVVATGTGKTTITVRSVDNTDIYNTCEVEVVDTGGGSHEGSDFDNLNF